MLCTMEKVTPTKKKKEKEKSISRTFGQISIVPSEPKITKQIS